MSSKTTELNVTFSQEDGDDVKDTPIPEQFLTKWSNEKKRFVTSPVDVTSY